MTLGLGVVHSHRELVKKLGYALLMNVLKSAIKHKVDKVVDYLAVFAEVEKGLQALGLEGLEVRVLQSSHSLDHVFPDFYRRREGFRVTAKDEPKVYVQHLPLSGNEEVLQVAVAYAEEVCY